MHSYYQIYPPSIKKTSVSASAENITSNKSLEHAMALTLYFASTFNSAMDTMFPKPTSELPDDLITALIIVTMTWI